jgi:hypothetical protein
MGDSMTTQKAAAARFAADRSAAERERLTELTCRVTEAQMTGIAQRLGKHLGAALNQVQGMPLWEQQLTWDRLATFAPVINHYMPPALKRGAELAVFHQNHATALPFLRAAAVLCDGWVAAIAHLLIAACCKELGERAGMDAACDAFERSRSTLELRSMAWRIPSLDPTGYDPARGPEWFPDEAAALRYVRNAERRAAVPESS